MATPERQPNGDAEYLVTHPLLQEILDGLETQAVETAVLASGGDDATRRTAMFQVQAIRSLRRELEALAHPTAPPKRGAVA